MTDIELLKLAAKAAGYEVAHVADDGESLLLVGEQSPWNPLVDDGDAFCLAVSLNLAVIPYPIYEAHKYGAVAKLYRDSTKTYRGREKAIEAVELYKADPRAGTRRAIVRAAAEIGKEMGDE